MSHARAAIAGALVMLLGIWVMLNDQSQWETRDVVFAVLALVVVILLLLGVDIRRGQTRVHYQNGEHDQEEEKRE
jgi:uncharacterized membrane protein